MAAEVILKKCQTHSVNLALVFALRLPAFYIIPRCLCSIVQLNMFVCVCVSVHAHESERACLRVCVC